MFYIISKPHKCSNPPLARMLFAREKYDGGMHDAEVDAGVLCLATCLNLPFNL